MLDLLLKILVNFLVWQGVRWTVLEFRALRYKDADLTLYSYRSGRYGWLVYCLSLLVAVVIQDAAGLTWLHVGGSSCGWVC